ncbi:MAG: single-stranded DNA-binding protein [Candidatus Taylorbacteria bacterium RIFCSPHIGHO2_01_FULL_44_110]|uniref:Single-stranded DNA-binding protein n=1 Tax=Candidatus Taylorbacteria bacterium RIFCSPHIGHO2_12_FULL_45_16 TaxID=1802315 RepID=A0A1G2MY93_9BACT|nr:MAG: single-stranded DNA-binding protein [Candidatus Taylorbacteria bacterium RIFCSPHIGHO2_01_FULL_44_110]OHA28804.1 MAG: single-stranded DNA-binding protein [Candidatus Taylorbacteria bacterium RIFCSPHIGHO2_12_FULL_45_16]OHA32863.1 MAG: single-stranded DNA-binding protein [Candidatus Taylorbacteria bacterium RIFCSPLOWO2_01_FULL_45_59]OHA38641.1 MAG: single-stranded DNA-binding protein [Candidatus Taylorbacteria bacterium RIFCSPLOWO2_02_FULL_45_10b]OHA43912.1 MAG: single-stranded DNA-binding
MYLNKALIIGNLTRDPELKALPSGIKVCSFGVATNRSYKDKDGNRQDSVEFHNVAVFGRTAELSAQYLKKGQQVLIEGRLQTRSWEGKDGEKRYRTEIIADNVQFGNKPMGSGAGAGSSGVSSAPVATKGGAEQPDAPADKIEYPAEEINPDDIPF